MEKVKSAAGSDQQLVLIVDDEPTNINLLAQAIHSFCQVKVARSAEQAFAILETGAKPDLILLDIVMPDGIDGIEACRRLKQEKRYKNIPVLFISGRATTESELEGMQAGAIDFIAKPFTPQLIEKRIKLHLQRIAMEEKVQHSQQLLLSRSTALLKTEELHRLVLETVGDGIIEIDRNNLIAFVNKPILECFGYVKDELLGEHLSALLVDKQDKDLRQITGSATTRSSLQGVSTYQCAEQLFRRKDGSTFSAEYCTIPQTRSGTVQGSILTFKDIITRLESATETRLSKAIFDNIKEGILLTDCDFNILRINPGGGVITGYSSEELVGNNIRIWESGHHDRAFYAKLSVELEENGYWEGEIWNRKKDGSVYPTYQNISLLESGTGTTPNYVSLFTDISRQKAMEEALTYQANHDPLTNLPNRQLFLDRLSRALLHSKRLQTSFAILFLDLDKFKHVNDTMGHPAGDQLLKLVAERLTASLRASDTVARLGGDEFTVILNALGDPKHAASIAKKLIQELHTPFELEEGIAEIGTSVGIAMFPDDGNTLEDLLSHADMAMFQAKQEGRNTYRFFTKELQTQAQGKITIEQELHKAIEKEELILVYQPIVDLETHKIHQLEALCRWHHPNRGVILPQEFIPIAEETPFIHKLNSWVLKSVIEQSQQWDKEGLEQLPVSLNIGTFNNSHGLSYDDVAQVLSDCDFSGSRLAFELTETAMIEKSDEVIEWMHGMRKLGISIVVDDFGTGYSSLAYLKRFPVDCLKIDQEFIHQMAENVEELALVRTICAMSKSLDLCVIAEGVETMEQRDLLAYLEPPCQFIQGHYIAEPMDTVKVPRFLLEGREMIVKPKEIVA